MLDTSAQHSTGKHGFSDDYKLYYFKDLVFNVEFNVRRKRISVFFNRENCVFTLKLGRTPELWQSSPLLLRSIDIVLESNYEHFQSLLHKHVAQREIHEQVQDNQYATGDIVYLFGLPYRLEVEYEMKAHYNQDGLRSTDSIEIVQEPQQLTLMMVPKGTARYEKKFELLYEEGYYQGDLLNELPVLVTQAAADYHNEWRVQRLQELKRAEHDLKTVLQEQTGSVFDYSSEEGAVFIDSDMDYSSYDDFYEDEDWLNDDSIVASSDNHAAFACKHSIEIPLSSHQDDAFSKKAQADQKDQENICPQSDKSSSADTCYDDLSAHSLFLKYGQPTTQDRFSNRGKQNKSCSQQDMSAPSVFQECGLESASFHSYFARTSSNNADSQAANRQMDHRSSGDTTYQEQEPLISERQKLTLNLPLQAGLILPPRHMQLINSVYLKRADLEYAWLFCLDQSTIDFDTLVRHYGACIEYLTAKLYGDLWQALKAGHVCNNHYLLDADGAFLELFAGIDSIDQDLDLWLREQIAYLCSISFAPNMSRFYLPHGMWNRSYPNLFNSSYVFKTARGAQFSKSGFESFCYGINAYSQAASSKNEGITKEQTSKCNCSSSSSCEYSLRQSEHINYESEHSGSEFEVGEGVLQKTKDLSGVAKNDLGFNASEKQPAGAGAVHGADILTQKQVDSGDQATREMDEAEFAELSQDYSVEQSREAILRDSMLEWYEARQHKVEISSDELELNMALCPLLLREKENQLLSIMALGDREQSPDIHLTPDITTSQHWELTGPLRDRLLFKKQCSMDYEYASDAKMREIFIDPACKNLSFSLPHGSQFDLESLPVQWDFGHLRELYVERDFKSPDPQLQAVCDLVASCNSNKAISWWPYSPSQNVKDVPDIAKTSPFTAVYRALNAYDMVRISKNKAKYKGQEHFYEHVMYLFMGEFLNHQFVSQLVSKFKQSILDKEQSAETLAEASSDLFETKQDLGSDTSSSAEYLETRDSVYPAGLTLANKLKMVRSLFTSASDDSGGSSVDYAPSSLDECHKNALDDREVDDGNQVEKDKPLKEFKTQFMRKDGINETCAGLSFTGYPRNSADESHLNQDDAEQIYSNLLHSRALAKAGEQYSLCVDLDSDLLDTYSELLKHHFEQKKVHILIESEQRDNKLQDWGKTGDFLSGFRPENQQTKQESSDASDSHQESSEGLSKLSRQVRPELLLPNMCWTLGAGGFEIDPAEALPALQDVFFPQDQEIDIQAYEKAVGMPLKSMINSHSPKLFGRHLNILFRERKIFEHRQGRLHFWQKNLVRPGVIKIKVAFRRFSDFDSLKECQYRFDILMRLARKQLNDKVLSALKLFCPVAVQGEMAYQLADAPDYVSFTELRGLSEEEIIDTCRHPLHMMMYAILGGDIFERCVIAGGVSMQGRCTRAPREGKAFKEMDFTKVLTISQTLAAIPFSYTLTVVAHECCHLQFFDHSRSFKSLLDTICPYERFIDYQWLTLKHLVNVSPMRKRLGKFDVVRAGKK